jgi:probable rRNA maturation factor
MSIIIENEAEFQVDFDMDELVEMVVLRCLEYENCPYEAAVSVTFTDNEGIRALNDEHRNIDKVTDVLSFPMVEYEKAGDFSILEKDEDAIYEYFDPDSGELMLGDIVISVERAKEQAEEYGHSVKREIGFLIAHSMFHLFGYDHMNDDEREDMEKRQREVLDSLKIFRG